MPRPMSGPSFAKFFRNESGESSTLACAVLDRTMQSAEGRPELADLKARVESLRQFFGMIDSLAVRLLSTPGAQIGSGGSPALDHLPEE